MISYIFRLIDPSTVEEAQEELEKLGLEHVYCIEDDSLGEIFIGGMSESNLPIAKLKHSILSEEKIVQQVDWNDQWAQFAEDFREGKAHIDLTRFGGEGDLLLTPGAGFGDLSHPTTYLMLDLMQGKVEGESVLDIGCGSGILTLAALKLGAREALGIDIDEEAIQHAQENGALNNLPAKFSKTFELLGKHLILLNMILPEQKEVMKDRKRLNLLAKLWIVSGILEEQEVEYMKTTQNWGWHLFERKERNGWLGFVFKGA